MTDSEYVPKSLVLALIKRRDWMGPNESLDEITLRRSEDGYYGLVIALDDELLGQRIGEHCISILAAAHSGASTATKSIIMSAESMLKISTQIGRTNGWLEIRRLTSDKYIYNIVYNHLSTKIQECEFRERNANVDSDCLWETIKLPSVKR